MKLFCLLISLLLNFPLLAQVHIAQGKLHINENSIVNVQGNVSNQATLTNQGKLLLINDWRNQGSYVSSTGTIVLIGTSVQIFDHHDQSLTTLAITGGGTAKLVSGVTIENTLLLEKGILAPEPEAKLMLNQDATIIGGSSAAYVSGNLYHTGLGKKFYPVGKEGIYSPVTLTNVQGDTPVVGIEFYANGLLGGTNESIRVVPDGYYWKQTVLSGTYDGSVIELSSTYNDRLRSEEEKLVVTGSSYPNSGYYSLGNAAFHLNGGQYTITSRVPFKETYLTLGLLLEDTRKLYIPNAFSLHASNPEDGAIKIYGNKVAAEDFYLVIQDAWGNIVFETRSLALASTQGWDGRNIKTNRIESSAVFKYFIRGKFLDGESFKKSGTILLY